VREAFWKQAPRVAEVLASLRASRIFLAPLFISEAYFSEQVIPRALGLRDEGQGELTRVQRRGSQTLAYCKPVGTHEGMTTVLLARAREVVEQHPFPRAPKCNETALFIAGHGTEQDENSRRAVERQVEQIRGLKLYASVHAVFLEEEPCVSSCYQIAQASNIVMVPFFISDGLHVREDIPVMLGEAERLVQQRLRNGQPTWRNPREVKGKRVWYAACAGSAPQIAEVILERVREAAAWT
jgi:sirohydrochlorin cobaltochelatase